MFRSERTYYMILGLMVLIFVLVELLQPKPLDWTESFSAEEKIPYGGYLIHEMLPELFPEISIETNQKALFEHSFDTLETNNWIFINNSFGLDQWETNKLLSQVKQGDQVFVAARNFNQAFSDSMKIKSKMGNPFLGGGSILTDDTTIVNFTNAKLKKEGGFPYFRSTTETHFSEIDSSLLVTVLGVNQEQNPNFLRIQFGQGFIFLHSNPTLFTNYFVRNPSGAEYAVTALSYLPEQPVIWDEYYKATRTGDIPLRYVVSERYLSWAWFISISGVVLFLIFRAKRKQRIIPHIEPPKNSSIEFAQTIGSLYLEKGDHKGLSEKKIQYFLEYIRTNLGLDTENKDDSFIQEVASRSGIGHQQITSLFQTINLIDQQKEITKNTLRDITQQIDQFYTNSER